MSDKIPASRVISENALNALLANSIAQPKQTPHPTPPRMRQASNTHSTTWSAGEWARIQRQSDKLNQLRHVDTANHFTTLPFEIKSHIFTFVGNDIDITSTEKRGLWAYANTSQDAWRDVSGFLQETSEGREIAAAHHYAQPEQWRRTAKQIKNNMQDIRLAFEHTGPEIIAMLQACTPSELVLDYLSTYPAIEIQFGTPQTDVDLQPKTDATVALVSAIRDKPIKLNAFYLGRRNFSSEFMPVLLATHPSCPLIVDLSFSLLLPCDLSELAACMRSRPSIYRLNLSDNDLSDPGGLCKELVDLFESLGPVTHLYLGNNGIDDETAAAIKHILATNRHLTYLNVRGNSLSASGVGDIIDSVIEFTDAPEPIVRYNNNIEMVVFDSGLGYEEPDIFRRIDFANRLLNVMPTRQGRGQHSVMRDEVFVFTSGIEQRPEFF